MGRLDDERRRRAWYERVGERLDESALQEPGEDEPDDLDALERGDLQGSARTRFLGYYTQAGLTRALEAYGLFGLLRERGFEHVRVAVEGVPEGPPRLRVHAGEKAPDEHVVLELVARVGRWQPQVGEVHEVLFIDWLTLREPRRGFTEERPRLPGQTHPGLGVGRDVLALLHQAAKRLGLETVVAWPDHYHNAILYGRSFRYHAPELEGRVRAITRAAGKRSLAEAAWAVEWGCLHDAVTGDAVPWSRLRGEQVMPVDGPLGRRYRSTWYRLAVGEAEARARYAFDWDAFEARLADARAKGEPAP